MNLDIMESASRLSSEYIAVEFNGSEKKLLNTLESVETSYPGSEYIPVEARYLTSGELSAQTSKTYTLKLWMDESVTVEDDAMNKSFISKIVVTAKQSHEVRLVDYIISETSKDFEKFEHAETYQTPALTDYRYTGSNPSNYVCFGSEEVPCPEDNLYRIIGVIPTKREVNGEFENRIKLIKNDSYGTGRWFDSSVLLASWIRSAIRNKLLNQYWPSLNSYQSFVEHSVWYLGGISNTRSSWGNVDRGSLYIQERGSVGGEKASSELYITDYIGLMYSSDYKFAATSDSNWMWKFDGEWTITPDANYSSANNNANFCRSMITNGLNGTSTAINNTQSTNIYPFRPTFYLKTSVLYKSGSGTIEEPYRIGINE